MNEENKSWEDRCIVKPTWLNIFIVFSLLFICIYLLFTL